MIYDELGIGFYKLAKIDKYAPKVCNKNDEINKTTF